MNVRQRLITRDKPYITAGNHFDFKRDFDLNRKDQYGSYRSLLYLFINGERFDVNID